MSLRGTMDLTSLASPRIVCTSGPRDLATHLPVPIESFARSTTNKAARSTSKTREREFDTGKRASMQPPGSRYPCSGAGARRCSSTGTVSSGTTAPAKASVTVGISANAERSSMTGLHLSHTISWSSGRRGGRRRFYEMDGV